MSLEPPLSAPERTRDEQHLAYLECWEQGWSFGDIARAFGVTRNVPLGVVHRIYEADPTALVRKPTRCEERSPFGYKAAR